jgi:hypothetical protein
MMVITRRPGPLSNKPTSTLPRVCGVSRGCRGEFLAFLAVRIRDFFKRFGAGGSIVIGVSQAGNPYRFKQIHIKYLALSIRILRVCNTSPGVTKLAEGTGPWEGRAAPGQARRGGRVPIAM